MGVSCRSDIETRGGGGGLRATLGRLSSGHPHIVTRCARSQSNRTLSECAASSRLPAVRQPVDEAAILASSSGLCFQLALAPPPSPKPWPLGSAGALLPPPPLRSLPPPTRRLPGDV